MEVKFIKFISLVLALFMVFLTIYTVWIGMRLGYCTFNILESQRYMNIEGSNAVYYEMNEYRMEIANESEFAYIICHISNGMRFALLFLEVVVFVVSLSFFVYIVECERLIAAKQRRVAAKQRRISRG